MMSIESDTIWSNRFYPFYKKSKENEHGSIQSSPLKIVKKTPTTPVDKEGRTMSYVEIAITVAGCKLKGRQRAFAADK